MSVQQEQLNSNTTEIYKKISKHVPEIEWKIHAPLIEKINKLKKREKCCNPCAQLSNTRNLSRCLRHSC